MVMDSRGYVSMPYGRSKKGVDGNLNPLPDPSSRIPIGACEVLDDQCPQKTYAKASDDKATTNTASLQIKVPIAKLTVHEQP